MTVFIAVLYWIGYTASRAGSLAKDKNIYFLINRDSMQQKEQNAE